MTAITAWPDILTVVDGDYKAFTRQAGAAISRGMACTLNSSGNAVAATITGTPKPVFGVAMDAAAIGDPVTLIWDGVVRVANSTSTAAIAIGDQVTAGPVSAYAGAVSTATSATDTQIIGTAIETIAVSSYGKILLKLR
jgi:hypothetical protein